MTKPAPFRRLPDRIIDAPLQAAPPRPGRPANTMLPASARRVLPAEGPGLVRVLVVGPEVRLVPSDRAAEAQLLAARAQVGWSYDAKAGRRIDHMGILLRNGASNFASVLLLAESAGLTLEIDAATRRAIARRERRLRRDLAPIPRVVWSDDATHGSVEVSADRPLGR